MHGRSIGYADSAVPVVGERSPSRDRASLGDNTRGRAPVFLTYVPRLHELAYDESQRHQADTVVRPQNAVYRDALHQRFRGT